MMPHTHFAAVARKGASTLSISAIVAFAVAMAATNAAASINNGVAVTTLPAPDGDGAYVFGTAGYASGNFWDNDVAAGLAYPVWNEINVPSGSTVKFVGGVALSSLPEGCTFDFSGCTHLFVTDASVFGSGFTVPAGMTYLFAPCTVTVSGTAASFGSLAYSGTIGVPLELNGTNNIGTARVNVVFNGALTGGATGYMQLAGFSRTVTFNGALNYGGKILLRTSQRNQRAFVKSSESESRIGTLEGNDWGNNRTDQAHGAPQQLIYTPASPTPCTLVVGSFNQGEQGGLLKPDESGHFRYRRWGVTLATCSNNTIRVENLEKKGAIHLMACSREAYTFGHEPAFNEGFGNFEIGHLGSGANGTAHIASVFYPSPNANLKITGHFMGMYKEVAPSVNYTAESNVVNRATLDTTEAMLYEWAYQTNNVTGYSPWNLPRTITSHTKLKGKRTQINVLDSRWLMPLDFGATADEIDYARCETDGALNVSASGTVVVSNATTTAGIRPIPGRYPVITGASVANSDGTAGAAAFADWTVDLAGGNWHGADVKLYATDTGLYIDVRESQETVLVFR